LLQDFSENTHVGAHLRLRFGHLSLLGFEIGHEGRKCGGHCGVRSPRR
jgi:hypothetical protein